MAKYSIVLFSLKKRDDSDISNEIKFTISFLKYLKVDTVIALFIYRQSSVKGETSE